jgi:hypothetical protein
MPDVNLNMLGGMDKRMAAAQSAVALETSEAIF